MIFSNKKQRIKTFVDQNDRHLGSENYFSKKELRQRLFIEESRQVPNLRKLRYAFKSKNNKYTLKRRASELNFIGEALDKALSSYEPFWLNNKHYSLMNFEEIYELIKILKSAPQSKEILKDIEFLENSAIQFAEIKRSLSRLAYTQGIISSEIKYGEILDNLADADSIADKKKYYSELLNKLADGKSGEVSILIEDKQLIRKEKLNYISSDILLSKDILNEASSHIRNFSKISNYKPTISIGGIEGLDMPHIWTSKKGGLPISFTPLNLGNPITLSLNNEAVDEGKFFLNLGAFVNPEGDKSLVSEISLPEVIFHEMGHTLEEQQSLLEYATEYIFSRSFGIESINKAGLIQYKTDFANPYTGTVNQGISNELISTGTEMFADPITLSEYLNIDREHILFTLWALDFKE